MRRRLVPAIPALLLAALLLAGKRDGHAGLIPGGTQAAQAQPAGGEILYYRHPDRAEYAAVPQRTEDGRDYLPVRAGEDGEPAAPPPAPQASGRILYYRNPMGLPDTSPVPKKDSMGMDYVPVREGEEDATVRVAPGRQQLLGVRTEAVARRPVLRPLRAPGLVQFDERRVSVVALRADAFVEQVENVTVGDRVRRGQPLLRFFSPEMAAAGAQYLSALAIPAGTSAATAEGARRRLENLAVPPSLIAEIERNRRVPPSLSWPAPRDGVVIGRDVLDGMRVAAGEVLLRIADLSVVWVLADLPERDLAGVSPGQAATVRARGLPGRAFPARVEFLYPEVNAATRTARLRLTLGNPGTVLLPGMYAEVEIAAGAEEAVLAVPDSAVIDSGTRRVVLLDRGDGRFEPREVRAGRRGGGFTELREGVAEGDRVVVSANFLIDAESNLRAALVGLSVPAAPTDQPAAERRPAGQASGGHGMTGHAPMDRMP
ncbi:efflux RND transporter periplasmic adaptor subunit [Roseomonas sp. BN140053]|uniref:efflux RND transporter periplasmic adaptor subunit n=1 Tax=Roseomonas sp. BN140053 TaxID=3391898 RepID=UPI0039E7A1D4